MWGTSIVQLFEYFREENKRRKEVDVITKQFDKEFDRIQNEAKEFIKKVDIMKTIYVSQKILDEMKIAFNAWSSANFIYISDVRFMVDAGYLPYKVKEEIKMTRQEAVNRLEKANVYKFEDYIQVLEILGLIKFEEEKIKVDIDLMTAVKECRATYNDNFEFLEGLKRKGYKVVKL